MNQKYEDSKLLINEFTVSVSEKTKVYLRVVDDNLLKYKEFLHIKFNCLECLNDILSTISYMKGKITNIDMEQIKESFILRYKNVLSTLEGLELKKYIDELNDKLLKFKDALIEKLESKEMEWIDMYQSSEKNKNSEIKKWPLFVMLLGAVACLSGSTIFHLCSVHSREWHNFLSRLDYAGISLLILGSCYPPCYYYFYCKDCK